MLFTSFAYVVGFLAALHFALGSLSLRGAEP